MTDTLRELLRQGADVEVPVLDPHDLVVLGERRLRRRRRNTVAAAVAAVVLVGVSGVVAGTARLESRGPVGRPGGTDDVPSSVETPTRPIVWSDDHGHGRVGALHVGGREVEIDQELHSVLDWSMAVTDAGAVFARDDHTVWFTDGGTPQRIASDACVVAAGDYPSLGLATGNAGPLVAWFDCAPASRGDLVVYDTAVGREVARHHLPACAQTRQPTHLPSSGASCVPDAVVGQHVYVGRVDVEGDLVEHRFRLDLATGQVQPTDPATYLEDLRSRPRTLVVGDTWQSGRPTEAVGSRTGLTFRGRELVPTWAGGSPEDGTETRVFSRPTGTPVRFRLPAGYQPPPTDVGTEFTIFEWLDDDTVALAQSGFDVVGDILVCHLADGSCRLAQSHGGIVPGLPLPG